MATIFTALLSWAAFGHALTVNFLVGVSIVVVSMHQFFSFGGDAGAARGGSGKGSVAAGGKPLLGSKGGGGMVYSPSMEHIRVSPDPENGTAAGAGRGEGAPLLPR